MTAITCGSNQGYSLDFFVDLSFLIWVCSMPVVSEVVHPDGLNFVNQRKVVMLRDQPGAKKLSFADIAMLVRNLKNKPTSENMARRVYNRFNKNKGRVPYKYDRCGRFPWKVTKEVGTFLIRRLLSRRRSTVCTSTCLQADLYTALKVKLSTSAIRKHLQNLGYHWLPRAQKRKYDGPMMIKRWDYAKKFARMGLDSIDDHVTLAMDGVIITAPPLDELERKNYCLHGVTHMWRKEGEAAKPELAGNDPYADQVPIARAIPLWGAISAAGFHEITYHKTKKLNQDQWVKVIKDGRLMKAIRKLQPGRHVGPRRLLCDNESFLDAKLVRPQYSKRRIQLLSIPAKSPDLNPIESFWGWLRQELRRRDLEDLRLKKPGLDKAQYKRRVKEVLRTVKAQEVAKAKFHNFKKVCQEVVKKKGAASRQ